MFLLLKMVQGSGFGFEKVLRNSRNKVELHLVLLLSFFVMVNENRKRRAGGAALKAGMVSCDQAHSPDR